MGILVTRPQPMARATARRLERIGHAPILLPLMQARLDPDAARAALALPHAALAVTSAQAIRVLQTIGAGPHLRTPLWCVGAATAQAAMRLGFARVFTGPGNGRGLADMILREMPRDPSNRLLYLAGHPRNPDFEENLARAGIPFTTREIYRMTPVDYPHGHVPALLTREKPQAVLLYSRETAIRFFSDLVPGNIHFPLRVLCLSAPIARTVPEGFGPIGVATTPDEDGLFALL